MEVGISPVYVKLTRRFVKNVGPMSIAAISIDSGIPESDLAQYAEGGALSPLDVMRLWSILFPNGTFISASGIMDAMGFER